MPTCPVCGVDIEEEHPSPDEGYGGESYPEAQTEHQGEMYQFCCSEHKEEFESSPGEYS